MLPRASNLQEPQIEGPESVPSREATACVQPRVKRSETLGEADPQTPTKSRPAGRHESRRFPSAVDLLATPIWATAPPSPESLATQLLASQTITESELHRVRSFHEGFLQDWAGYSFRSPSQSVVRMKTGPPSSSTRQTVLSLCPRVHFTTGC